MVPSVKNQDAVESQVRKASRSDTRLQVSVIIPACNEERTVGTVIERLLTCKCDFAIIKRCLVVNNGSTDATAEVAARAGATVIAEPVLGYGRACLTGLRFVGDTDVVLFVDADGSDVLEEWPLLVRPLFEDAADLIIGARIAAKAERGALGFHQRFGNRLATFLLNMQFGTRLTDLGPFRAIHTHSLQNLGMRDEAFGWTIEMELLALKRGLRVLEVPVSYKRRQAGRSKISGTIRGSFLAGSTILSVVGVEWLRIASWKALLRRYAIRIFGWRGREITQDAP